MPISFYRTNVAPLLALPLHRTQIFTYVSTAPIPKGSLVSVPFGRQHVRGIVFECALLPTRPSDWMKPIDRIIESSLLTESQLRFAEELSESIFAPLGRTLLHAVPEIVSERIKTPPKKNILPLPKTTAATKNILSKITRLDTPMFLRVKNQSDLTALLTNLGSTFSKKGKQILILVPEIILGQTLFETLSPFFPSSECVFMHSKLSKGTSYRIFRSIASGEAKIIIGTRQALFLPFQKLGSIFVTDEDHESYKQWDMTPRYDARTGSLILRDIHRASLLFSAPIPRLETALGIEDERIVSVDIEKDPSPLAPISLINLRLERYRKNYSSISEELRMEIDRSLSRKERILLIVSHQEKSSFVVCEECKSLFRCPTCQFPLSPDKRGSYSCKNCSYHAPLFPNCPQCKHIGFRKLGKSTLSVEREVKKLFPRATIARIDPSLLDTGKRVVSAARWHLSGSTDILISTPTALALPPLPKTTLIAMIDADRLAHFKDFRTDERLFQTLVRARSVTPESRVFIQSFEPDGGIFKRLSELDTKDTLKKLLDERRVLGYPPFSSFLAIELFRKDKEALRRDAETLRSALEKLLPKNKRSARIHLTEGTPYLVRKKHHLPIFLRLSKETPIPKDILRFLKTLPKDTYLDVDPLNIA